MGHKITSFTERQSTCMHLKKQHVC